MTSDTASIGLEVKSGIDVKTWSIRIASCGIWFLPLIWIDPPTYLVLTIAGLAFGMLLFMVAAGMTIIFGLMDVLNMAHGALFALGAYTGGYWLLNLLETLGWVAYGTAGQSLMSLLLAILMAALAGALLALYNRSVTPSILSINTTIDALAMTIIGGVGTLIGPILGATIVSLLGYWLERFFGSSWTIIYGTIFMLIVVFLPYGIIGTIRARSFRWKQGWQRWVSILRGEPRKGEL